MLNPRDKALLMDIAGAARHIASFTGEMDEAAFLADVRTQFAVQHQILVIGEVAKRLSPAVRADLPEIPWTGIARMRDRLIHGYDTVDLGIVWDTAHEDVPARLRAVASRLARDA